jgi:uncharacterized protein involved in exopolysaccharide biosynthesis
MVHDVAALIRELSGILQRISKETGQRRELEPGRTADRNPHSPERPLEALQQQNQALESLIERLKERSKKG